MLPERWPLVVLPDTTRAVRGGRTRPGRPAVERVVCATDAGREGELIFRYIYEAARRAASRCSRLWMSSLTPEAIRGGFAAAARRRRLRAAGRRRPRPQPGRLAGGHEPVARLHPRPRRARSPSAGCRRPTLAMVVERELAIRGFVPEDYLEVVAPFAPREAGAGCRGPQLRGDLVPPADTHRRGQAPASRRCRGEGDRRSGRGRPGRDRVGPRRDAAHAAAAALRPHRAPAPRQPSLRLERPADPGGGADALRAEEAAELPAHRQPPPVGGRGRHAAGGGAAIAGATPASSPRAPESGRSAGASSTTRRSPTTTRSSRPRPRCEGWRSPATSGRSTTWSAGGCSRPGTPTTSGR